MHQQGCTLPTTAVILRVWRKTLPPPLNICLEHYRRAVWSSRGSQQCVGFRAPYPCSVLRHRKPWIWWVLGISGDRTIPVYLWVLLCHCFSSLMRAEHTIKFYWVFMLTKLTNSWCFKNAARALSSITGNLQWLFNWCRTEQMCECQCHLTANNFILTFYWPELINWNFQNKP